MSISQLIMDQTEEVVLHTYNRFPVVFDHGEGVRLYDADGKEYSFGLNLSYDLSYDDWPKVSMMGLISVDSIPEKLTMSMKDQDGVHVLSLPDGQITVEPAEE